MKPRMQALRSGNYGTSSSWNL